MNLKRKKISENADLSRKNYGFVNLRILIITLTAQIIPGNMRETNCRLLTDDDRVGKKNAANFGYWQKPVSTVNRQSPLSRNAQPIASLCIVKIAGMVTMDFIAND